MTDPDYTEPSNEQLASFLSVYARNIDTPGIDYSHVSPAILEWLLEKNPVHRATALRHHRVFQEQIKQLTAKILAGAAQCEHIRPNGKPCPNYNQPGSHFCGLHQDQEVSK